MFRFHLPSFIFGCLVGTSGISFIISILSFILNMQ